MAATAFCLDLAAHGVAYAARRPPMLRLVTTPPETLQRDHTLVSRAQAGDREALGELLRCHGPALYRSVLLPRLGSAAAAEDALSETYTKVLAHLASFTWRDEVGFYPWFRMVGIRVVLDQFRKRKRTVVWSEEDVVQEIDRGQANAAPAIDDELLQKQDAEAVRAKLHAALAELNPRYAEAIRLRVLAEQSREAVAEKLGVSVATFDVLLHRALSSLKKKLAHD